VAAAIGLVAAACGGRGGAPAPTASGRAGAVRLTVQQARYHLPSPVERAVAVVAGDTVVIAGGLNEGGQSVGGVFTLNPASGALSAAGTVPMAFHDAAAAAIGDRLFVFGGGTGESSDMIQAFDLQTHRSRIVGHLPKALSDLSSAVVGSTVFLVGGYDGVAPQASIYSTMDGAHLRAVGRVPKGLRYAAVAVAGGRLMIAGGVASAGPVATVYGFDPTTGGISMIGRLPVPVGHAAAFELGGRAFVCGGRDARGRAVRQCVAIAPVRGSVTSLTPLRTAVGDAAVASDGRQAWLIGGWRGGPLVQVLVARLAGP